MQWLAIAAKAVEDYRSPRRFATIRAAGKSARFWTAPVPWRIDSGDAPFQYGRERYAKGCFSSSPPSSRGFRCGRAAVAWHCCFVSAGRSIGGDGRRDREVARTRNSRNARATDRRVEDGAGPRRRIVSCGKTGASSEDPRISRSARRSTSRRDCRRQAKRRRRRVAAEAIPFIRFAGPSSKASMGKGCFCGRERKRARWSSRCRMRINYRK